MIEIQKTIFVFMLTILTLMFIVGDGKAVSIIPRSTESWTCYDYAVNYSEKNPEWGIATVSDNPRFRGTSHMINYQVINTTTLRIHDETTNRTYTINDWENLYYWHFWNQNETPVRRYRYLTDNGEMMTTCD